MKAMIFAAGLGTRLRPLTDTCPKALIEIGGQPMLWHVLMRLKTAGITEVVINVHHHAHMIIQYLVDNDNFGMQIHISDESSQLLDTGGGILKAREWLDAGEPFLVHNADIFTDMELDGLIKAHTVSSADVTLDVSPRQSSRMLYFNHHSLQLCGWKNLTNGATRPSAFIPDENMHVARAFSGIHIASPLIFESLARFTDSPSFSIIPYYLSVCSSLNIHGYEPTAPYEWFDIGKPDTLEAARNSNLAKISYR